jgi:cold-inducible RNA-binding protein
MVTKGQVVHQVSEELVSQGLLLDRGVERRTVFSKFSSTWRDGTMGKRLYVGNLPYRMSEEELLDIFAQVGTVLNAAIIIDRETGRSRGFGFVEMEEESAAAQAVQQLNGAQVGGRTLKVAEANPRPTRSYGDH